LASPALFVVEGRCIEHLLIEYTGSAHETHVHFNPMGARIPDNLALPPAQVRW